MKDFLHELVRAAPDPLYGKHLTREYLQARILGAMQQAGAMIPLAFQSGTALRFLYQIPRYSEDLDFALEGEREQYDFRRYLKAVAGNLAAEDYTVEARVSDSRAVHSGLLRFRGLLHDLGLSGHRDEVFAIKIEVDTRPPAGAGLATTVVRRHIVLRLQHHDRPSLLAGKLHAILQRPFTKGRDLYDLLWYLSDPGWPSPNLVFLNNALAQTGWSRPALAESDWRPAVAQRLDEMDWRAAEAEVQPFLIDRAQASLLTRENLRRLLNG
jgi:hypothetical protein